MTNLSDFVSGYAFRLQSIADATEVTQINAQTGTTYTFTISDRGQTVTGNNPAATTFTIPTDASVPFDIGTVIFVVALGAGAISIVGAAGVTVNGVSGGSETISAAYKGASLLKVGINEWVLDGGIS